MTGSEALLLVCVAAMVAGAVGTAFVRDVVRMVLSLGLFLVGVALVFLALASPLLAVSQVFVYVGGVLVLVLFALMVARREGGERPRLATRHDVGAAATAVGVFVLLTIAPPASVPVGSWESVEPDAVAESLLGSGLAAFELAGAVLLAALLGVLVIVKAARGEARER